MNGLQYALDLIDRSFGRTISQARTQTQGLDSAVNRTNNNIRRLGNTGSSSLDKISSYARKAGTALLAYLSISAVSNFAKEVTNATAKFEGLTNAISFASGKEGANNLEFLDDRIAKYSLNKSSSYKGFQTLTGSLKGTSLEGKKTRDIFEAVGIAATVMNLSAEQSEGAFLALGQMASKGTVQAEELRGQLGERIPGAFGIAAKAMGVTQSALGDMLKAGEVQATDFLPKFAAELRKTFESGVPKALTSVQSAINRQENALLDFKLKVGDTFRPLIIGSLEAANKVFGFLGMMMDYITPVKDAFGGIVTALQPFFDTITNNGFMKLGNDTNTAKLIMEKIAEVIRWLTPVFEILGLVLMAINSVFNEVRIIILDVIKDLTETGNVSQFLSNIIAILKKVLESAIPVLRRIVQILGEVIKFIIRVIDVVLGLIVAMMNWISSFEVVHRTLNAFIAVVHSVFSSVRDIVTNTLGGIADLIVGVFTLDADKIKSGLVKGLDASKDLLMTVPKAIKAANEGWNKELNKPINKTVKITTKNAKKPGDNLDTTNDTTITDTKDKDKDKKKKKSVSGSGSGDGKHMTFNIQSFVKELTIQTTTIKESPQEIRRLLEDIFNEAMADIEIRANA
ncbi:tape measure protein [Chryseobacterium sp.]|uniref:tape measure protein n=1 Tax=Chryseobacterium sp. TaxID=1871047 RepID=UPI00289E1CA9|nr:tape measure protein [Chryseobacterium sp.]